MAAGWAAAAAVAITPMWTDSACAFRVGYPRSRCPHDASAWARKAHLVTAGQMAALVGTDTACGVSVAPKGAWGVWAVAEYAMVTCRSGLGGGGGCGNHAHVD